MNKIQIIATIGPSSKEKSTIKEMVERGMSIARLNFSWGTHDEHLAFVEKIRAVAEEKNCSIPIIQDLSGPRVQEEKGHTFDAGMSVITEKDIHDLVFAEKAQPEYVALSFVRSGDDIRELRNLLAERSISSKIIAKIEREEALHALDSIIEEADGIMIARGDLGENIPLETLPFVTKDILKKCTALSKPVVVATQMLTSMIHDIDPARADITDIAQAVLDGTSATMLSDETAIGEFPVEAVALMRKVVDEAFERVEMSPTYF